MPPFCEKHQMYHTKGPGSIAIHGVRTHCPECDRQLMLTSSTAATIPPVLGVPNV